MLQTFDTEKYNTSIYATKSVNDNSVYVSFSKGAIFTGVTIGKTAARELADSIMDILEEMSDDDHSAQSVLPLNEQREAA